MFILRTYSGESMDSKIVTVQLYSSRFYRGSLAGWCVDVLQLFSLHNRYSIPRSLPLFVIFVC